MLGWGKDRTGKDVEYLAKIHHLFQRTVDVFDEVGREGNDDLCEKRPLLEYPLAAVSALVDISSEAGRGRS